MEHHLEVEAEAEQHHSRLQQLFGGEVDARLPAGFVLEKQGQQHARQDGEYRPAHHGNPFSQQPRRHRQEEAQQDPPHVLLDNIHVFHAFLHDASSSIARKEDYVK